MANKLGSGLPYFSNVNLKRSALFVEILDSNLVPKGMKIFYSRHKITASHCTNNLVEKLARSSSKYSIPSELLQSVRLQNVLAFRQVRVTQQFQI